MAALVLIVGFIGLIEAVTVTTNSMEHARRQTLATQILNHEIEELYLSSWANITALPAWAGATPVDSDETALPIDRQFWPAWSGTASYEVNSVVTHNGVWYRSRLGHTGRTPPNATYWTVVTAGAATDIVTVFGANFTLVRTVTNPDPVANIREVNFTVTWVVKTSRRDTAGNQVTFTHTRSSSAWYGKDGLQLSYRQS